MSLEVSVIAKIAAGAGGFLGGALLMALYRPKNMWDAAIRSSISTAVGIVAANPLLVWLSFNPGDWETNLACGTLIGFMAWSVLSIVARSLFKLEEQKSDVLDVYQMVKRGKDDYVYDPTTDSFKKK